MLRKIPWSPVMEWDADPDMMRTWTIDTVRALVALQAALPGGGADPSALAAGKDVLHPVTGRPATVDAAARALSHDLSGGDQVASSAALRLGRRRVAGNRIALPREP